MKKTLSVLLAGLLATSVFAGEPAKKEEKKAEAKPAATAPAPAATAPAAKASEPKAEKKNIGPRNHKTKKEEASGDNSRLEANKK